MSSVPVATLEERAHRHAYDIDALPWADGVDESRWFFPADITPLSFTATYHEVLHDDERLSYNQGYAIAVSEQFIFLEQVVLNGFMRALLRGARRRLPADLVPLLERFVEEEEKHTEMFRRLLRLCRPEVYEQRDYHYFTPGAVNVALSKLGPAYPHTFVVVPLLAMVLEEKTVAFYREYEKAAAARPDTLDPLHHAVHRFHMLDETRHVHIDEHLVRCVWEPAPAWKKRLNLPFFFRTLRQYTTPRRRSTNANLVHALVERYPRLTPYRDRLLRELFALKDHPGYQSRVNGRSALPRTFAMFDAQPEIAGRLDDVATAYRTREATG